MMALSENNLEVEVEVVLVTQVLLFFSPNIYNDGDDKDDDDEEDISNTSVALLFSKHLHLRSNIRLNTRHLFGETMMSEC